ncbi:hypothetical protein M514_05423 [Trichuris suis]|uniref:Uncharacterized protein n=1 Tax=Trichuris suis TaxID=68888 RepID=A0A085NSI7_9BILA|nr:hypothetical protein M513_05423 [Trichuris suis]KFD72433.1 hypothetical protein M514_05423 [Trichuris suis]
MLSEQLDIILRLVTKCELHGWQGIEKSKLDTNCAFRAAYSPLWSRLPALGRVMTTQKWNDRECVTPAELRSSVSELVRYVIAIKKFAYRINEPDIRYAFACSTGRPDWEQLSRLMGCGPIR